MAPGNWLDRRAGWILLLPCLVQGYALFDPPYWDNLTGAFPQGFWLARHGFDALGLFAEKPYLQGGPRVYPSSVYPWLIGVLYAIGLTPKLVFAALHVVSILCAWWSLCTFRRIARVHFDAGTALLATLALGCAPLFMSLTAQTNMDMPLLCATLVAFEALCARKGNKALLAAAIALHIKPTGILVVATIAGVMALDWVRARKSDSNLARRALLQALGGTALCLLGVAEAYLASGKGTASVYVGFMSGVQPFLQTGMRLVPEYGALVFVFAATLPFWLVRVRRQGALPGSVEAAVFLCVTVLAFAQFENPLPRYLLQSLPILWLWFLVAVRESLTAWNVRPLPALTVLSCAAIVANVANRNGVFYSDPPLSWLLPGDERPVPANDGHMLERSMRYRDDLMLELELVRRAEAWADRGCVLVAAQPVAHMLGVPEFGYTQRHMLVAAPFTRLTFDDDAVSFSMLYTKFGNGAHRITPHDVVFVLSPSRFASGRLQPWPQDEVLDAVEVRGRRAVILRRRAWE